MEVKGEYGRASSTVGGRRYGSPPPLALCQLAFSDADMSKAIELGQQRGVDGRSIQLRFAALPVWSPRRRYIDLGGRMVLGKAGNFHSSR